MTALEKGKPVPDFTLPASDGSLFTLSAQEGQKVLLYFYPKDATPGCTDEACDFRDYNAQFGTHDTVVVGISPDPIQSHGKFIAKHELPFLLLSDEEHRVSESFGVWVMKKMYGREYMGVERSTFLIDEEGKLIREWRKVKVKGHVLEVLEAVKTAKTAKTAKITR
jgi:peroxiredoxin Q/BCP